MVSLLTLSNPLWSKYLILFSGIYIGIVPYNFFHITVLHMVRLQNQEIIDDLKVKTSNVALLPQTLRFIGIKHLHHTACWVTDWTIDWMNDWLNYWLDDWLTECALRNMSEDDTMHSWHLNTQHSFMVNWWCILQCIVSDIVFMVTGKTQMILKVT